MAFDKKQLEVLLIQYFRECYTDFPKGKLSASESPDFILKMKNRRELGIELTRLNPANKQMPNEKQTEQINIREKITDVSQDLFEQSSELKLFVKFLFSEKKELKSEAILITSARVVNTIRNKLQTKNHKSFFCFTLNGNELPEGLDELLIVNHPEMENSVWERSNNLGISNNVVDDIRLAIDKKQEKLRLYQKQRLNYYWLLITTDHLRGVKNYNLVNRVLNHSFYSNFQKVFLFDLMKSKIYPLI